MRRSTTAGQDRRLRAAAAIAAQAQYNAFELPNSSCPGSSMMLIFKEILQLKMKVVLREKFDVLFLKRQLSMMKFLIGDVRANAIHLRITHRECAVTFLPFETTIAPFLFVCPA